MNEMLKRLLKSKIVAAVCLVVILTIVLCAYFFQQSLETYLAWGLLGLFVGCFLSNAMNIKLSDINGEILLSAVKKVAKSIAKCGLKCTLGGQIRPNSVDFISGLTPYLSCFETRNLVFDVSRCLSPREALEQAVEFELLCLRNRNYHWSTLIDRNQRRIDRLTFAE